MVWSEGMDIGQRNVVDMFTGASVKRDSKSGWAFTARDGVTLARVMGKSGDNIQHVHGGRY